jgi:hypothetical protein
LQRQFPTVPPTVTTQTFYSLKLRRNMTFHLDLKKLLSVSVVNELSEYLRQNGIHNKGTTSNIGYVKYSGWNRKKNS